MGAAAMSVTWARSGVVDYTVPIWEEPMAILIPPASKGHKLDACVKPFQWPVRTTIPSASKFAWI